MHDRIIALYEDHAAEHDRQRRRGLTEAELMDDAWMDRAFMEKTWLDRFLAQLPAGGSILDIGCGSGHPVARYMIGRGYAVTGVDSSPSLITVARGRFPAGKWIVADMRDLDIGKRYDGLIAWHSFFHLSHTDQREMFARFAAHAAPGAALMFTSGPEHGEAIGEWMGDPLYHASLDADEYRALLDAHGFDVVAHRANDPDCGGATVWLAQNRDGAANHAKRA